MGHTHVCFKQTCVGSMASSIVNFCRKTRTVHCNSVAPSTAHARTTNVYVTPGNQCPAGLPCNVATKCTSEMPECYLLSDHVRNGSEELIREHQNRPISEEGKIDGAGLPTTSTVLPRSTPTSAFSAWTKFTVPTGKKSGHPRGIPLVTRQLA
jgi:hypothetical protein